MTTEADKTTTTQSTGADATTQTTTTQTATTEKAPAGGSEPWYASYGLDDEARAFIAGKGVADPATAIKSWISADRLARERNVLEAPDVNDIAAWKGWESLGWVADETKYQVELPAEAKGKLGEVAGVYEPFHADIVKQLHAARVPLPQARQITNAILAYELKTLEEVNAAVAREKADLEAGLKRDWGQAYEANREVATRAMKALGLGEQDAAELDALISAPRMVKLFHALGQRMGEDSFVSVKGGQGGTSRDQALAQKQALEADPAKRAALMDPAHPQHAQVKAERERLQALAFGQAA